MHLNLVSEDAGVVRLSCEGNITQEHLQPGTDLLQELLGPTAYTKQVYLDLEQTQFIDSSGVGWILGCHKRFERDGGRLVLHSLPPMVEQVFELLKLHTILRLAPNLPAARRRYPAPGGQS